MFRLMNGNILYIKNFFDATSKKAPTRYFGDFRPILDLFSSIKAFFFGRGVAGRSDSKNFVTKNIIHHEQLNYNSFLKNSSDKGTHPGAVIGFICVNVCPFLIKLH